MRTQNKILFSSFFLIFLIWIVYNYENFKPLGRSVNRLLFGKDCCLSEITDKGKYTLADKVYPDIYNCEDKNSSRTVVQVGQFIVIKNYIIASVTFPCNETITYTTHGEYRYLDNLVILAERWQGPISVAIYAPGDDFYEAVKAINFLRFCVSPYIDRQVTFHMIFDVQHFPHKIQEPVDIKPNCIKNFNSNNQSEQTTYRKSKNLLYPINVARNVARTSATSYFVLASDIELYPSINIIPEFFEMIWANDYTKSTNKRVFALPIFEVLQHKNVPETKNELLLMLNRGDAILFHQFICRRCHLFPDYSKWKKDTCHGSSVSGIGKRTGLFVRWEPLYIGTNDEPLFDERLTLEGRADKMTQAYAMCLLDYEYHVLNNAFLAHRPGIKVKKDEIVLGQLVKEQEDLIFGKIVPEYKKLYGDKKQCKVKKKLF